jgi:hypothetical protein
MLGCAALKRQVTPGATLREAALRASTTRLTRKGALAPLCRETLTFAYPLPSEAVPTEVASRLQGGHCARARCLTTALAPQPTPNAPF